MAEALTSKEILEAVREAASREGASTFELAPLKRPPAGIPASWRAALTAEDPVRAVLDDVWKPIAKEYAKTISVMRKKLHHVGLLKTAKDGYSLIYVFALEDDEGPWVYRGRPPAKRLPKVAAKLPAEFLAMYAVHDGWLNGNKMMGPRESRFWGALGKTGPSAEFLVTFEGHGPGILGFDMQEDPPQCFEVWNHDPPERVRKIAKRIDQWLVAQLEDHQDAP